jgi:hypothetical protein
VSGDLLRRHNHPIRVEHQLRLTAPAAVTADVPVVDVCLMYSMDGALVGNTHPPPTRPSPSP